MLNIFMSFFSAVCGGFVQAVTGFGGGIVMMLFLPYFMSIVDGAAVSSTISIAGQIAMITRYRKHIKWKAIILPSVCYMILCGIALHYAPGIDTSRMKAFFGLFLLALAIYFIFLSNKIRFRATPVTAVICASLSGGVSGLFGIGGPPMAMYYLTMFGDDKYAYLATLQMFFFVTNIYSIVMRIVNGILTGSMVGFIIAGFVGILLGSVLGAKVVDRINADRLRKIIYAFLAIVGTYTFFTNI